ncbi:MAG: hypothetical protein Q9226_003443 [Calogaya cf. arnoldii]
MGGPTATYYLIGLSGGKGNGFWKNRVYTGLSHSSSPANACPKRRALQSRIRLQERLMAMTDVLGVNPGPREGLGYEIVDFLAQDKDPGCKSNGTMMVGKKTKAQEVATFISENLRLEIPTQDGHVSQAEDPTDLPWQGQPPASWDLETPDLAGWLDRGPDEGCMGRSTNRYIVA